MAAFSHARQSEVSYTKGVKGPCKLGKQLKIKSVHHIERCAINNREATRAALNVLEPSDLSLHDLLHKL